MATAEAVAVPAHCGIISVFTDWIAMSDETPQPGRVPGVPLNRPLRHEEICDALRTSRLNAKYYGDRLETLRRWNLGFDLAIAVGTSGTLAATAAAKTGAGTSVMITLAAIAATLGVVKPVLALARRIERAARLWAGWNGIFNALRKMTADIAANEGVRPELVPIYAELVERMDQLTGEDDSSPDRATLRRIQDEVNEEFPPSSFWCPKPSPV